MFRKLAVSGCAMALASGSVTAEAATFNFDFVAPIGFGSTDTYIGSGQLFGDDDGTGAFTITGASGVMFPKGFDEFQSTFTGGAGKIFSLENRFVVQSLSLSSEQGPDVSFTPASSSQDTSYFIRLGEIAAPAGTLTITSAVAAVPEPATWAMMVAGFGVAGIALRRRQRVRATVSYA